MLQPDSLGADSRRNLFSWICSVDHKRIGIMYMLLAVFFLLVGGFEALLIRAQLAVPKNDLVSPQMFNQLFTLHGTTMIFLVGMPVFTGFSNFIGKGNVGH